MNSNFYLTMSIVWSLAGFVCAIMGLQEHTLVALLISMMFLQTDGIIKAIDRR